MREGGLDVNGSLVFVDRYLVHLAAAPTGTVYVTVSAACSPLDEANGTCLADRARSAAPVPADGDTILLASGARDAGDERLLPRDPAERRRHLGAEPDARARLRREQLEPGPDGLADGGRRQAGRGPARRDDQPQRHRHSTRTDAPYRQRRRAQRRGDGARQRPGRPRHHAARRRRQPGHLDGRDRGHGGHAAARQLPALAREGAGGRQASSRCRSTRRPTAGSSSASPAARAGGDRLGLDGGRHVRRRELGERHRRQGARRRRLRAPGSADERAHAHASSSTPIRYQRHELHVRRSSCSRSTPTTTTRRTSSSPRPATARCCSTTASRARDASKPCDDYTIRLTQQPTGNVTVSIVGDGQADVVAINGVAITPVAVRGHRRHPAARRSSRGNVDDDGDDDHPRRRLRARQLHARRLQAGPADPGAGLHRHLHRARRSPTRR